MQFVQVPGACTANCSAAEVLRGMIDHYAPLGEVRASSKPPSSTDPGHSRRSGGDEFHDGSDNYSKTQETGLPRLCQVSTHGAVTSTTTELGVKARR